MNHRIISSILAALLLAMPLAIAAESDYWYYGYPYGGSGRSYESYQRTYDTTRSDVASRNIFTTNTAATSGYGYPFPYSYSGWYQFNPGNPWNGYLGYPYTGATNTYTNTYSDNYNRQYSEKTNEMIKVDKYIAYDNQGVVRVVDGDNYGSHHPYYYSVISQDAYNLRYPYAGLSYGDRGYYSQSYYSSTAPTEVVIKLPEYSATTTAQAQPLTVKCPPSSVYTTLQLVESGDGPSQTYGNSVTDRGPIYTTQRPAIEGNAESAGALRNPCDRSSYDSGSQRDTMYVVQYTRQ